MYLKSATAFANDVSMQSVVQNNRAVLLDDFNFLYLSDEKEATDNEMSKNTVAVEMMGEREEDCAKDV